MIPSRVYSFGPLLVTVVLLLALSATSAVFRNSAALKRARCIANCLTEVGKNSKPDPGCHGDECQKCIAPCKVRFQTIQKCKSSCKNSKICEKSCQFLLNFKRSAGDNTIIEKPGTPVVVAKTLSNITLSWKPANSSAGSVVYVLKERYNGDFRNRFPIDQPFVFLEPKAVFTIKQVCRFTPRRRFRFNGLNFYFTVVALTETSRLSSSKESSAIQMKRPDPVEQIAMPRFRYDPKSIGDKVRLTTTVTPTPGSVDSITRYAMTWDMKFCRPFVVPRTVQSKGPSRNISMHIYQKLKACNHTLTVHSLVECIPSLPKTLNYEYKGCRFIENFNKTFCHSFDPPPTPGSARAVSNLRHGPLKVADDFRVSTTFLWQPPTFPFAPVSDYHYAYGDVARLLLGKIWLGTRGSTKKPSLSVKNLLPNITVRVQVTPSFPNAEGVTRTIIFKTPAVPENQIQLSDVRAGKFVMTSSKLLNVRVSWKPPTYSKGLVAYQIEYKKGTHAEQTTKTNETFYVFSGIAYSEPLLIEIKPLYKFKWVKPKGIKLELRAPAPKTQDIVVRDLKMKEVKLNTDGNTFSVNFTWQAPVFKMYKAVDYYQIYFHLLGRSNSHLSCPSHSVKLLRKCPSTRTKAANYLIPMVYRKEFIVLTIKAVFKNSPYVIGFPETITINPLKFTCDGKLPGVYKDLFDCTAFYYCDETGNERREFCQKGLIWNDKVKACDWRTADNNCIKAKEKKSFCDGKKQGYYKDPLNCSSFYRCEANGRTHHFRCPNDLFWDDKKDSCGRPKTVDCKQPKKTGRQV